MIPRLSQYHHFLCYSFTSEKPNALCWRGPSESTTQGVKNQAFHHSFIAVDCNTSNRTITQKGISIEVWYCAYRLLLLRQGWCCLDFDIWWVVLVLLPNHYSADLSESFPPRWTAHMNRRIRWGCSLLPMLSLALFEPELVASMALASYHVRGCLWSVVAWCVHLYLVFCMLSDFFAFMSLYFFRIFGFLSFFNIWTFLLFCFFRVFVFFIILSFLLFCFFMYVKIVIWFLHISKGTFWV